MTLNSLKSQLYSHPNLKLSIALPDGRQIPSRFHITEAGRVTKEFVDCGGTFRRSESCTLQAWLGNDEEHRLDAGRLARILEAAKPLLPSDDLPVEVEYEEGVTVRYPVLDAREVGDELRLTLGLSHTDCLAKDTCGQKPAETESEDAAVGCCGGGQDGCCG